MKTRIPIGRVMLIVLVLVPTGATAQVIASTTQQATNNVGVQLASNNAQNLQAISQTGLLPVFAVAMNFDPSWVNGDTAPSKSASYGHNGVNDKFQSAWDKLKSAGFNTIHFALDLQDAHSAARLANLCIWAKRNNVTLIPLLQNIATSNAEATFPTALVSALRAGDGQNAAAYTQIAYFQVETTNVVEKQETLVGSIDVLRNAELKALQGSGVQPTPIMASVSFDYELIKQGAIADVPLDQTAEQKAQASLNKFVMPLAANANVDAINVVWFPRSISSGDEGHFSGLLRELQAAAPEKQVLLTTGFSTAFHPADQQEQFLTVALTNLWDFRVSSGGINSHFIGVIFEQAFQGAKSDLAAPAGGGDPSQWNWSEKAQQLAQMWSGGKSPEDLRWWLNKVEANRGLLSMPSDASGALGVSGGTDFAALPGLQTLQQIASTFAQASQNVASPASGPAVSSTANSATNAFTNPAGIPAANLNAPASPNSTTASLPSAAPVAGTSSVAGPSAQSPYQQLLMMLVQQVTPQITSALITKLTNHSGNAIQGQYPGYPAQVTGATGLTTNAGVSQSGGVSGAFGSGLTASPATASGGGISLGPQDVMADATNVIPGQTAHITAQIHNLNINQDISGLTIQLLDPTNAASSAQNMQTGVFVARSGTTPVQLSWLAGQQNTPSVQLTVQVLDATGAVLASAPVPVISVMNSGGVNSAPTGNYSSSNFSAAPTPAGSAMGNTAGSLPVGSTPTNPSMANSSSATGVSNPAGTDSASMKNSSSNLSTGLSTGNTLVANSTGSTSASGGNSTPASQLSSASSGPTASDGSGAGSGSQPSGSSSGVVPQIAYFGPAGVPGQPSTFLVQVVNPGLAPMSKAQAQIYIDGKPGQAVAIEAMLPQQSRSVVFDQSLVSAGNQTVKVVVTAGSQSASATASASANLKNAQIQNSRRGLPTANRLPVRSGIAAQYSMGTPAATGSGSAAAVPPAAGPTSLASSTAAPPLTTQAGTTAQSSGASGKQTTSTPQTTRSVLTGSTTAQQSSGAQPPAQAASTVRPLGCGASTQISKPASVPVGGSVGTTTRNPGATAPTPRTIQPSNATSPNPSATTQTVGSTSVGQTTRAGATGGSPNAAVRTIQPAGSTTNQTTRTIQPPGSTSGGQITGTVQPSGTSATQTARTIEPPSGGATSQSGAGAQTSSGATPTQTARTILPPGSTASAPNRAASGAGDQNYLDLSVSMADIRVASTPQAGQVIFTALIRNLGTVSTGQASVIFRLTAGNRVLAVSQPTYFNIPGSGTYQANWTTLAPAGQNLRLAVSVSAAGDVNPANNQAAFNFTAPQPAQTRH